MTVARILDKKGHTVFSIAADASLKVAIDGLAKHRIGVLVVTNAAGEAIGIVSERDVISTLAEHPDAMSKTAADIMTSLLVKCSLDDTEGNIMERMVKAGVRHLPVYHGSKMVGLISARDILNLRIEKLHELMAEIMTEVARVKP